MLVSLVVAALNFGVLFLIPDALGELVLGDVWHLVTPLLLVIGLRVLVMAGQSGVRAALMGRKQISQVMKVDIVGTVLSIVGFVIGAALGDAEGAYWGSLVGLSADRRRLVVGADQRTCAAASLSGLEVPDDGRWPRPDARTLTRVLLATPRPLASARSAVARSCCASGGSGHSDEVDVAPRRTFVARTAVLGRRVRDRPGRRLHRPVRDRCPTRSSAGPCIRCVEPLTSSYLNLLGGRRSAR